MAVIDFFISYDHLKLLFQNPLKLILIIVWNYIFVDTMTQMVQMTGVLFSHVFFHIYYAKVRFNVVQQKLQKFSSMIKTSDKKDYKNKKIGCWPTSIVTELTTTLTDFLRLSKQLSILNGAAYFFGIFSLEYELYLLVHGATPLAMRSCAFVFFALVLTMLTTVYTFYSRFHAKVKFTILKEIHTYQYHIPLKVDQTLMLAEKEFPFGSNMVGMNIAGIFTMTRQAFINGFLTFVANFMLIISLTEN